MKSITENLALFSLLALTIGASKTVGYYQAFGINISPYFDFSEIFQMQFSAILLTVMFFIAGISVLITWTISPEDKERNYSHIFKMIDSISSMKYKMIITFTIMILTGLSPAFQFVGRIEANNIINGESINEIVFKSEDTTIFTSEKYLYIGATRNYIFFYNKEKEQSSIFKLDNMKSIQYSKGLDYTRGKE